MVRLRKGREKNGKRPSCIAFRERSDRQHLEKYTLMHVSWRAVWRCASVRDAWWSVSSAPNWTRENRSDSRVADRRMLILRCSRSAMMSDATLILDSTVAIPALTSLSLP